MEYGNSATEYGDSAAEYGNFATEYVNSATEYDDSATEYCHFSVEYGDSGKKRSAWRAREGVAGKGVINPYRSRAWSEVGEVEMKSRGINCRS